MQCGMSRQKGAFRIAFFSVKREAVSVICIIFEEDKLHLDKTFKQADVLQLDLHSLCKRTDCAKMDIN